MNSGSNYFGFCFWNSFAAQFEQDVRCCTGLGSLGADGRLGLVMLREHCVEFPLLWTVREVVGVVARGGRPPRSPLGLPFFLNRYWVTS